MKIFRAFFLTTTLIFFIFLTACSMDENETASSGNPATENTVTLEGELLNTKGGPSVNGTYLPEFVYDEFIGKTVKVSGKITTVQGGNLVNEAGEYSAGFEGSRKVMTEVESFEVVE